jgi:hypothetical protein
LNLALPPLLTDADDVHRLSAALFTISYACASLSTIVGGALWDATGIPATAFTLVAAAGLLMAVLALGLDLPRTARYPRTLGNRRRCIRRARADMPAHFTLARTLLPVWLFPWPVQRCRIALSGAV